MYPQKFNPEITVYMRSNGFKKTDESNEIGVLTFRKDDMVVLFWNDKIEKRIISSDKLKVNKVATAFKGFDGQNVFHLMLILHLLGAVDLKTVSSTVYKHLDINVEECMEKEFHLNPVTA